jgi:hypothetical protein
MLIYHFTIHNVDRSDREEAGRMALRDDNAAPRLRQVDHSRYNERQCCAIRELDHEYFERVQARCLPPVFRPLPNAPALAAPLNSSSGSTKRATRFAPSVYRRNHRVHRRDLR